MSKKISVFSLVPVILSILLVIGTVTVFQACGQKDDGTFMHCHTAQNGVMITGIIMTVLFAAAAFINSRTVSAILYIAGILGGIAAILIPGTLVSMCMMSTMRCYTMMQPFVRIFSVIVIITAVIRLISIMKKGKTA